MPDLLQDDQDRFLSYTSSLWEDLRGERLFLTGGTGFVGCWLLETFTWANDQLGLNALATVLTRNPAAFSQKAPHLAAHPAIRLETGDIRSFAFPAGSFRYLIHAAADANMQTAAGAPLATLETIVDGTKRTLEFSRRCGVEKYLLTSSGAVYGTQPPGMVRVPEDYCGAPDATNTRLAYGQSKRLAELLCAIYTGDHGISCRIARCFAFAGPYLPDSGHFAFASFVRDALRGETIRVKGDGTPVRSYLYAADLAVWLWTILLRGTPGKAYNVGSENEVSIGQLAGEVAELLSPQTRVEILTSPAPGARPARYVPSTRLAREELALEEFTDRRESIVRTADWYRQTLAARHQ